jgi:predicted Na+-dependent transporter
MAGGNVAIATSLQVTLATLAVVTTPLTLLIFTAIFAEGKASADFLIIAKQVLTVQFLPLGLGLLIRRLGGEMAANIGELLKTVANILFIVLLVFLLGFSLVTIPTVSWRGLAVIPPVVIFGLICGHLLGGPELETRSSIATGTIARNAGPALFLVAANGVGQAIPTGFKSIAVAYGTGIALSLPARGEPRYHQPWVSARLKNVAPAVGWAMPTRLNSGVFRQRKLLSQKKVRVFKQSHLNS